MNDNLKEVTANIGLSTTPNSNAQTMTLGNYSVSLMNTCKSDQNGAQNLTYMQLLLVMIIIASYSVGDSSIMSQCPFLAG